MTEAELPASGEMGLFDHLRELRKRLMYCAAAVLIGAVVSYSFSQLIFEILSRPYYTAFPNQSLIGTGPAEAFLLKIKTAIFVGIIISAPVLFYQCWLFILPGLYDHERKLVFPFLFFSTLLFVMGITFCYMAVFPFAFAFFKQEYESINLTPTIRLSEHLSMVMTGLLSFGAVFELPVVAYFLGRLGIIDDKTLIGGTRYAVVVIFIIAALLTPPDVISQFLMAGPLMVLYGISILVVKVSMKSREHSEAVHNSVESQSG